MSDRADAGAAELDPQKLLLQNAALREALLNVSRVTSDYWRRVYIGPVLDDSCPSAQRLLLDAQCWRAFWQLPLRDRRTLILHDRARVEERLETLESIPAAPSVFDPSSSADSEPE